MPILLGETVLGGRRGLGRSRLGLVAPVRIVGLCALGAGAVIACGLHAEVPSRAYLGAEAVAIRCTVAGPLAAADADRLCRSLVAQARDLTRLPVRGALPGDAIAENELVIDVSVAAAGSRPKDVLVSAAASRTGLAAAQTPRTRPLPLALAWGDEGPRPAGPVRALELFLASPGGRRDDPRDWQGIR